MWRFSESQRYVRKSLNCESIIVEEREPPDQLLGGGLVDRVELRYSPYNVALHIGQ